MALQLWLSNLVPSGQLTLSRMARHEFRSCQLPSFPTPGHGEKGDQRKPPNQVAPLAARRVYNKYGPPSDLIGAASFRCLHCRTPLPTSLPHHATNVSCIILRSILSPSPNLFSPFSPSSGSLHLGGLFAQAQAAREGMPSVSSCATAAPTAAATTEVRMGSETGGARKILSQKRWANRDCVRGEFHPTLQHVFGTMAVCVTTST